MKRKLDDWIATYLNYTFFSEAPDIFHFWSAVGILAGALRRKVYFDQGLFQWTPNQYIILVANPGIATKSTTMNIGARLLRQVPGIYFGADAVTWQALVEDLSNAQEEVAMPGGFVEMSCLTFLSSELGNLLDPHDRRMLDLLVNFWDGWDGEWKKSTKSSGRDVIMNPWLNIIACTTPAWLADNFPRSAIGGGFTSRCVWVHATEKRKFIAYPKRHMKENILALREPLLHDLELISQMCGEFTMTEEAYQQGEKWYMEHWKNPPRVLTTSEHLSGHIARKQGLVHKLAMVISASKSADLRITWPHLEQALRVITAVERDLPKVFQAIFTPDSQEDALHLIQIVRQHPGIPKATLIRTLMHRMKLEDINKAIDTAIAANLVTMVAEESTIRLKPTQPELDKAQGSSDTT